MVSLVALMGHDPFAVLVSCLISLRTKDQVTEAATQRLFALGKTPDAIAALSEAAIAKAIYPAGFYKTKAATIRRAALDVRQRWGGSVPETIDELLTMKGVGRKTANLVVSLGHGKPAICVDTHVHRIMNRLNFLETATPEQTEMALRAELPRRWWSRINGLLVAFGQRICLPVSPHCSSCPLAEDCPQREVGKHR